MLGKRLRYTVTRLCLDSGSIAVLKYMEPFIPLDGTFSFVLDSGRELKLSLSPDGRIYGLGEYFRTAALNVNDALFITPLADRRLQLESVAKSRDAAPRLTSAALQKPATERIVEHESDYIREVRIAAVSPYPNGIMFPQQNTAQPNPAQSNPAQSNLAQPNPVQPSSIQSSKPLSLETSAQNPEPVTPPTDSKLPVTPGSRLPLTLPLQTAPVTAAESESQFGNPALNRAADVFAKLGYDVSKLESGLLLETRLGRLGHRVAVGFEGFEPDAVLKQARVQGIKYLAVVAPKDRLGLVNPVSPFGRVAKVELEALDNLEALQQRFNITPLELEGYWNAEGISAEALESLQENATSRLESRGAFSFVTLALKHFDAPCIVTPEDICGKLPAGGITTGTVIEILETLCKAPFNILTPVGLGEYHLKIPLGRGLTDLSEYVTSLRLHLRVSAGQKADARMTTPK